MTFTATLSHAEPVCDAFVTAMHTLARDDPYFTSIGPCAFSPRTVELFADAMPSVKTKLFNKGALQLTGCKSHVEAMHTIAEVCRVLTTCCGKEIEALTMSCALINMNVMLDTTIRLSRFADAARARGVVAEQPERPPSCILKRPSTVAGKSVTGLVYKSGSFVICGAQDPRDVSGTYHLFMRMCDELWETVLEPRRPDGLRRGRGTCSWTTLIQCGMPGLLHTHPPTKRAVVEGCAFCARRGNFFYVKDADHPNHAPRHRDPEIHGESLCEGSR
jgi:TATA-box binding protein (TBP) (component of TFIID and TFIIIB)